MPKAVTMPKLDQDMENGTISAWHKRDGDNVQKGDVLFEIETDKAAIEVEAQADGKLHHILAREGDRVPVDQAVAWIYANEEEVGDAPVDQLQAREKAPKAKENVTEGPVPQEPRHDEQAATQRGSPDRMFATPAAVSTARLLGISLSRIAPTGPGGRIQKSDVLATERAADWTYNDAVDVAPANVFDNQSAPLSVLLSGTDGHLPIVMLHGFLADASAWEAIVKPLSAKRRIYRVELPCHGGSPLRRVRNFADLAAQMRQAFDLLGLEQCHLVGHSLGGAIAMALADTRPRMVASLTLIAPAGLGPEFNGTVIEGLCRATRAESIAPWLKQLTADPEKISWSYVQAVANARSEPELRLAQRAMSEALFPDSVQAFDLRAALDRVSAPTRIIWGREDKIIPWRHALAAPGRVSLNLFNDTGHLPQYERIDEIITLLSALP